jgi:phosphomannomutase
VLALLAESLMRRGRIRGGIAKTFSTSMLLDRVAAGLGVRLHVTPIGFKYIAEKMMTGEVAIGGEESGGLGVAFHLPERDGVLSALLVLEAIAHSGGSLEAIVARQDAAYGVLHYGRRDLHLAAPVLRTFLDGLRSRPPASRCGQRVTGLDDMDGVKLIFGSRGWLLHRLSGTEPVIRIYAEHEDPEMIRAFLDETEAEIGKLAN